MQYACLSYMIRTTWWFRLAGRLVWDSPVQRQGKHETPLSP